LDDLFPFWARETFEGIELLTWHAIRWGQGRCNQQTTEDAICSITRNTYFKLHSAVLSHSCQTLCPAHYSRCLATETCRDLISYIRIVYLKKFPWLSSIEIILRLFPPNQEYPDLQFL
jgi:hypothetical protein